MMDMIMIIILKQTWCKFELLLYSRSNPHGMANILSQTKAGVLNILIVLSAIELIMIWDVAVVEVVQPRVAYSTNKTGFVKHTILHCHALKDFHWLATFWLVTPVCPDYRSVGIVAILRADLHNS